MHIPKITRDELVGLKHDWNYLVADQMWEAVKTLKRKDGVGGELLCRLVIHAETVSQLGIDPKGPEFMKLLDDRLEESIALDLSEINHEGPFANLPMDEAIHDLRLELGLETVLL